MNTVCACLVVTSLTMTLCNAAAVQPPTIEELSNSMKFAYERFTYAAIDSSTGDVISQLKQQVSLLVRQLMMQQLAAEERARSDGDSGLKKMRLRSAGSRPYHTSGPIATIHDHSNNIRTVGMGEFTAVLNGVEFRTRHNDYGMRQPSKSSTEYNLVQDVQYPEVPPAVLNAGDVDAQITEMRKWFNAWKNQDHSERDYRPYFKAALSYLEGTWTTSIGSIEESFFSDRHFLEAKTWFDLQEKVRYSSYSGSKSINENLAYLPTKVMNVINDTHFEIAQWNYRILTHPLSKDLPLNRLRVIDDLDYRMAFKKTIYEHERTRGARFSINQLDTDEFQDKVINYGLLDDMMEEIPGKDNYPADMEDVTFGSTSYEYRDGAAKLNAGYYHRSFRSKKNDAQGLNSRRRGYHDANLFMAMTSHPEVSSLHYEYCPKSWTRDGCALTGQRWSYAIPLEVIYMTPLQTWNPYNLEYKGDAKSDLGKTVNANGRWGSTTEVLKAYNGINSKFYYITPAKFFNLNEEGRAAGDTTRNAAGVLDRSGQLKVVKASGIRVMLPYIQGIGSLRTRYPVMSIYEEGNTMFKHLAALQDIVLNPKSNAHMLREDVDSDGQGVTLDTGTSLDDDEHVHRLTLTAYEVYLLKHGRHVEVTTGIARVADGSTKVPVEGFAHQHIVSIKFVNSKYYIYRCDGKAYCTHRHRLLLTEIQNPGLEMM